jgi:hypothetical protein
MLIVRGPTAILLKRLDESVSVLSFDNLPFDFGLRVCSDMTMNGSIVPWLTSS